MASGEGPTVAVEPSPSWWWRAVQLPKIAPRSGSVPPGGVVSAPGTVTTVDSCPAMNAWSRWTGVRYSSSPGSCCEAARIR